MKRLAKAKKPRRAVPQLALFRVDGRLPVAWSPTRLTLHRGEGKGCEWRLPLAVPKGPDWAAIEARIRGQRMSCDH